VSIAQVKVTGEHEVVMVDDSEGDLFLAHECYAASRCRNPWKAFSSGAELLEYLGAVRRGEASMPALVLLDLNMPGMSGIEVLERTRDDPYSEALPVFCILSSSSDPRDRARARALGAAGFVTKPGGFKDYVAFFDSLV
jgi:two-component system response regulator